MQRARRGSQGEVRESTGKYVVLPGTAYQKSAGLLTGITPGRFST